MPNTVLTTTLSLVRRRWRLRLFARAVAIGGAAFALALVLSLSAFDASRQVALWIAVGAGASAAVMFAIANRRWSALDAAKAIELAAGSLDNLVITAAELDADPRPIAAEIRQEINRQTAQRLGPVDIARVVPLTQPTAIAAAILAGCALLASVDGDVIATRAATQRLSAPSVIAPSSFKITISPPPYTKRSAEVLEEPVQVSVIAGSRIRIDTTQGTFREWVAIASEGVEIRTAPDAGARFLSVMVVADAAPSLRVVAPGKDTAFAAPIGQVPITVESSDDLGLATVTLHFTKASGGGENLAFTEGNVPLVVERRNERQWVGRASLALETLGLADGDIVVYRAIARDTNPNGSPVQSEQYLIEIGRTAQIAAAGFSLPTDEKKYAISQQMVIYKTEQLLQESTRLRRGIGEAGSLEQSRMIAIEQRMVRAEVVFLGGGEVEDEVEEAAHSDELAEGRMQNTGRVEMMRALNAMSRAEALLNEGRPKEALVFEREALASLERALDRRRYFLRTLPDRSRIDVTRRLTGTRTDARSWLRDQSSPAVSSTINAHRRLMRELVSAAAGTASVDAALAARVTAIDPSAVELQQAAVAIASAPDLKARQEAIAAAMRALTAHALRTLPAATAIGMRRDALAGGLAAELRQKP
ncbi:MAG: hypothetical protein ABI024_16875 [Vicinamibacterales bacterium]